MSIDETTVPLAGDFDILLNGTDSAGNILSGSAKVKVRKPDTEPPAVSINSPSQNQNVMTKDFKVDGLASDNVIVSTVLVSLDGQAYQEATLVTGAWSLQLTNLSYGPHYVEVVSIDGKGNTSAKVHRDFLVSVAQPSGLPFMFGTNKLVAPLSTITTQDKLLKFGKDNGFDLMRVRVYRSSHQVNPALVNAQIKATADAADKYGIKVIWTFMQYQYSPYFNNFKYDSEDVIIGKGSGFPADMVQGLIGTQNLTTRTLQNQAKKLFLRKLYDNAGTYNGKALWDDYADWMISIFVNPLKDRPSTFGYEIANEPEIVLFADYDKLRKMQEHIGNKIVAIDTDARIIADNVYLGLYSDTTVTKPAFYSTAAVPRALPTLTNGRTVYGPHFYQKVWADNDYAYNFGQVQKIAALRWDEATSKTVALATPREVILGEWDVETWPADPIQMTKMRDSAKAYGFAGMCHYGFDSSDMSHSCFDSSYNPTTTRNVWPAMLQVLGHAQVGSPK